MNDKTTLAVLLFAPVAVLAVWSGWLQVRGLRDLRARHLVPSDEYRYFRNRHRRRLLAAGIMFAVAGLVAAAYLSGMEAKADALAEPAADVPRDADGKRILTDDDRDFARAWGFYWLGVIVLVMALIIVAVVDVWAGRRYWHGVYKQLKDDHDVRLRRDLEVYRQQKSQRGKLKGFGGRLGE